LSFDFATGTNLLVASTGGHLAELWRLQPEGARSHRSWVTFDTPQSRDLLRGEDVTYVPYVAPRDVPGVLHAARRIARLASHDRPDVIVSTGAAVALSAGIVASLKRIPMVYIESIARLHGPSLTGSILARSPRIETWTQVSSWANKQWPAAKSVLAQYERVEVDQRVAPHDLNLFVTVGTIAPYRFDALIDSLLKAGLVNETTTWQLGSTTRHDLPGRVHAELGYEQIQQAIREADVIVTHAGVGTVLDVLEAGKVPVVVPRTAARREHVDDHQMDLARHLAAAQLSVSLDASELRQEEVLAAAGMRVRRRS
jgi:UDP-N-acetylglucosamine--N-acetylmuramyl-(pentapeptide) pyrophosphoryl-undecaprenol N-acetylglucosamine transferase